MPSPAPRPWVKICANTTLSDALMAADLGADAVGFVFAPSSRQVTVSQVAAITPHLPASVERVGVFAGRTSADLESIARSARQAGLSAVQLHGALPLASAVALQQLLGPEISVIQTAHWTVGDSAQNTDSADRVSAALAQLAAHPQPFRILIDAKLGPSSGGLGIPFNWSGAQPSFAAHPTLRIILAGGLRPDNLAEALRVLNPWGVDVASGVEQSPGRKDPAKLAAFLRVARQPR